MAPYLTTTTLLESEEVHQKNNQEEHSANKKYRFLFWEFETPLIWINIVGITVLHILALCSLVTHPYFEKPGIVLYGVLIGLIGGFGITGGVHRYWTHRTFKAKLPLKLILLFCYSVAGQNSIKEWVQDHRVHHKFSETDADPHNSRRGFFFAHVGWLMMRKHPEVIRKGRQIGCSDLFEDPIVAFHQKYFIWIKLLCCFFIPTIIPPLLWGESWIVSIKAIPITRYALSLNYTWLVNSAAHIWGNKPYDKDKTENNYSAGYMPRTVLNYICSIQRDSYDHSNICPVENLFVSFFAIGEGYHNFHHTFPWDYRAAEMGKYLNLTTYVLDFFQKIGWVYDTKSTNPELIRKVVENHGDGSYYRWGQEVPYESSPKES